MSQRGVLFTLGAIVFCLVAASGASSGPTPPQGPPLNVTSVPGNGITNFAPARFSRAQLAAMPQQNLLVTIGGASTSESGPALSAVLTAAGLSPISSCKNDELRYWIAVDGKGQSPVTTTSGELDPGFGNNPAILSITENGSSLERPRLVFPSDATDARDIPDIDTVTVGRAAPQLSDTATPSCTAPPFTAPVIAPEPGSVVIDGDVAIPTTLTWDQLERLPQITQTDTFQAGRNPTTVTEAGPTLFDVLSAVEPEFRSCNAGDDLRFYVEVTSSEDGYASTFSWAEIQPLRNGKQMLLSLSENGSSLQGSGPRSTAPGDPKGGRYVSGVGVITVVRAPGGPPGPPGCPPGH
jgi:hypothetical protein